MFSGFTPQALELLGKLPGYSRDRFQKEKKRYVSEIQDPLKAFVDALGPVLQAEISPGIEYSAKTHGTIAPINNDIRFDPTGTLYKDYLLLRFWEGADKKTAPTLFVRMMKDQVGFGCGTAFADVERWRSAIDEHGDELEKALARTRSKREAVVVGDDLKRVPKPYDADHPHADLLRHKWFQVRWPVATPPEVSTAEFVRFCADELKLAGGVHGWLVRHLS